MIPRVLGALLLGALLLVATAIVAPSLVSGAGAAAPEPTLVLGAAEGQIGDLVPVTLEHWPAGLVTLSVCGNNGGRGSQDCDLRSAFTLNMPPGGGMRARVVLVQPPTDCPCVIRASTVTNELVRDASRSRSSGSRRVLRRRRPRRRSRRRE